SGETFAELPSQWRGFLLDQRLLRNLAIQPADKTRSTTTRLRYEAAAAALVEASRKRALTADEAADLGALSIRLGELNRALDVLRLAQRQYPDHFRLAANLGTTWHLLGDLEQAVAMLQQAVRLAPERCRKTEELHLRLV